MIEPRITQRTARRFMPLIGYVDPFNETCLPEFIGHGSAHDVSNDFDDRGLYLPDGTWRPLQRRPLGFA